MSRTALMRPSGCDARSTTPARSKRRIPLGRFGTTQEIAKAVVFLASDDGSDVTGTELCVDGGFAQV